MVKTMQQAGQMGLFMPESDWVHPTELPDLRQQEIISLDLETRDNWLGRGRGPGWVASDGHVAGVSVSWGRDSDIYVPLQQEGAEFDKRTVVRWLSDTIRAVPRIVTQAGAYDWGWLRTLDIATPDEGLEDIQIQAVLLDENQFSYSLDDICARLGVPGKDEEMLRNAAHALGLVDHKAEMWKLPAKFVGPYAMQDSRSTLDAFWQQEAQIEAQSLEEAYAVECGLVPMVLAMRARGIRIDSERAYEVIDYCQQRVDESLTELSRNILIGRDVTLSDIESPDFLERVFDEEKIPYPKTEKTKRGSFTSDWMEGMDHWLPQNITRAKKYNAAGNKFVGNYILEYLHKGRLYAEPHQVRDGRGGTRSHRFSYSNPPLQQMPARDDELAPLIRGLFLPEPGELWLAADYSQQEYRLMVEYGVRMRIPSALDALEQYLENPKTDFHAMVAEMTGLDRKPAKDTNFAKAFGAGVPKFALMTNKSLEEAREIMEQYDKEMPFIKRLGEKCKQRADAKGFVKLIDGARCRFDRWEASWIDREVFLEYVRNNPGVDVNPCDRDEAIRRINDEEHLWSGMKIRRAFTHKAMNRIIQGGAARQMKKSMLLIWRERIVPLLQMHDELDFSTADERVGETVSEIMRTSVETRVPMLVDGDWGTTWGDASPSKEDPDRVSYARAHERMLEAA